jgi:hypothetical protein
VLVGVPARAADVPKAKMVAFPSAHVEVVIASTGARELGRTGVVRAVVINERGLRVRTQATLREGGHRWVTGIGGGAAFPGATVFTMRLAPRARAALARCRRATLAVEVRDLAGRRVLGRDSVVPVRDAASCRGRIARVDAPARPEPGASGMAVPSAFVTQSAAALASDLADIQRLGARWLRVPVEWPRAEPRPGQRRWQATDRAIGGATARGLRTLGLVTYAPRWAQAPGGSYPRDPVRFAAFAARAAARYAPYGVRHWEVWNEENYARFWAPYVDPAAYARLLRVTSVALHAVQPKAVVLFGGLARVDFDGTSVPANLFLEQALASGVLPQTDAIAVHPYSYPFTAGDPTADPRNAWRLIEQPVDGLLASLRLADQEHKPLWITEFGAPDHGSGASRGAPDGVGLDRQATMVADVYAKARAAPWAGPVFWYADRDTATTGSDAEGFFGLLRADGSEKPAAGVYRAVAR